MKRIHIFFFLILLQNLFFVCHIDAQNVKIVKDSGDMLVVKNEFASFTFSKSNAAIVGISYLKYQNILGVKGSAYINGPGTKSNGGKQLWLSDSRYSILRNSDSLVEISFVHTSLDFIYDLRYVLMGGVSGIYCYLVQTHISVSGTGEYEQTRWGIRADESLFDYHLVRDSIQGLMPRMADLKDSNKIQDWTYKLANGTIYTKYNYADYIEGRYVHGMAGRDSHIGMFVIQASHEYLNGGPTKQYQTVHSSPYLINMFNCGHFLLDKRISDNHIQGSWTKLDGPFLLYLNSENNISSIWSDAKRQAVIERGQWPYGWMRSVDYPSKEKRGVLKGRLVDRHDKPIVNALVVLADSGYDWQAQTKGYIYSIRTNVDGVIDIHNIRSGRYALYVSGNNQSTEYVRYAVNINEGSTTSVGKIKWTADENSKSIFQIGTADRFTTGFKYGDHVRAYGLFDSVPANLDFYVGKDHDSSWYYAQTKVGTWKIHFLLSNIPKHDSVRLLLNIAGVARNPRLEILLNGHPISILSDLGNDAGIYRSAVKGAFYESLFFDMPRIWLNRQTGNLLELKMTACKKGAGIMYDAIKLIGL